ncbi:MAG: hypothetical protein IJ548_00455 [Paludibacteraceae bacterium]|nr:hypothetical protein [Paludibacteraceae bacterium]MBQ8704759.1 hypothetical protein [Paludibacteraceae bacterium]
MKRFISLAAALLLFAASYAAVTDVSTLSQLANAVSYSSDTIHLTADITYGDTDGVLYVPANKTCVIDLDWHVLQRNVTNSANTIRPAITIGRGANLTLIDGDVRCYNTQADASIQPCAVYMPGDKSVLNLDGVSLYSRLNGSEAPNAYGVITEDQDDITINARYASINCLYLKNLTHVHTINLFRVELGEKNRKNLGYIGLKADAPRNIEGVYVYAWGLYGTNLSAAQLLSLIPDQDMKYFSINGGSQTEITRAQIAQMTNLQNQSLSFFPDLNFSVSGTPVTKDNCDNILSDGKARFDFLTNTLYLKNTDPNNFSTISGIYWTGFDLTVEVEGRWRSGQILSYDGDLTVRAHHRALTEEDADLLSVTYVAEEPFAIHDADIRFKDRIKIYAESDRTHDPAFLCRDIFVEDSWLDAWGKSPSPVANYRNAYVFKASIKVGSFRNNNVIQIEPQFRQYYLHVQTNGWGTVTGEGWYNEGTEVTISATPNEGYYFARWNEDNSTEATRTATVTENAYYTAIFLPEVVVNYYDINVVSSDETMGTVSGGGTHIEEGQPVTLTATPNSGYEFMYWTNLQGYRFVTNPLSYTVGASDTYTAHFRQIPNHTSYSIYLNGTQITSNNQNDVLGDGVWAYDETTNTLTTMKAMTYNITNTDFIDNYISDPVTIVLNHFITINASTTNTSNDVVLYSAYGFHITGTPKQRLTINGTDMRLIYAAFGPVVIDHVVMLDAEQTITSWGETNLTTKCAVQLKGSDDALTVNGADVYIKTSGSSLFKATNRTDANLSLIRADIISGAMDGTSLNISNDVNRYILHYSNADLEDICPVYGGFGFHYPGEIITIEAFPKEGYLFVQWSDGVTDNPRVITMPEHNLYIDPIVEVDDSQTPKGAIITADATEGQGSIIGFTSGWYTEGTQLTLTAQAAAGYEFVQWSDGVTENPRSITVEDGKNINITAVFKNTGDTTGIEQTPSPLRGETERGSKYLRNGLLFIERNGKTYNAQGQIAK